MGGHIIGSEVYYATEGGIYSLSNPKKPILKNGNYSMFYCEAEQLYYVMQKGVISTFDPVTGEKITLCETTEWDSESMVGCVTDSYIIYGSYGKYYRLDTDDLSVTALTMPGVRKITGFFGNTIYYDNSEEHTICTLDLETLESSVVCNTLYEQSVDKTVVCGDDLYFLLTSTRAGRLYRISGVESGEYTEPEQISPAGYIALDMVNYEDGIIYAAYESETKTVFYYSLTNDGETVTLARWANKEYNWPGFGNLSVSDGLLAHALPMDESGEIFTYELR